MLKILGITQQYFTVMGRGKRNRSETIFDNKFYKIDLTRMTSEDSTVFVSEKHFKTEQKQMRYPGNSCDLKFTPI